MGWSFSPFQFCRLSKTFVCQLRTADLASSPLRGQQARPYLKRKRWKEARGLPYVDEFMFLASSELEALQVRERLEMLLDRLGLLRQPTKGFWELTHFGHHMASTSTQ
jgi:hypothetical protein